MDKTIINLFIAISVIFGVLLLIIFLVLFNKKVLRKLNIKNKLLFYFVPITALFGVGIYYIFEVQQLGFKVWFLSGLSVIYLIIINIIMKLNFKIFKSIEQVAQKLSEGKYDFEINFSGSKEIYELQQALINVQINNKKNAEEVGLLNREFTKFVPKQFFDYLGKKDIYEMTLGSGIQKEVTVLFCDIRDSFRMSESLSLEENFKLINSYLTVVAKSVRKFDGFIDKYLGDGVLCVFLNANNALRCAEEIAQNIENRNLVTIGDRKIDFGIAMHTGKVVIGVIGEKYRLSPTIISDSVNLASRLEGINKLFGTKIIFTKDTLDTLSSTQETHYRYLGTLELDDNKDLIPLFESLDCFTGLKKKKLVETATDFENGVRLFEKKDFAKAKLYFMKVFNAFSEDNVCKLYLKKCNFKLRLQYKKK